MRARARSTGTLPQAKTQTLIVVQAFKRNGDGEIVPALDAREMPDERRAIARARELSLEHAGAIAWKREVNPDEGEFGEPTVLFSRGELPDLDMPVPAEDEEEADGAPGLKDGDGDGEASWMGIRLRAAADWQAFHQAFLALYRQAEDKDLLAVFTALENRRIVLLPPEAARLVQRELPAYPLTPCERPPREMISLELGHTLQLDTTWFELPAEERERRRVDLAASEAAGKEAEAWEFDMLFPELPESPSQRRARQALESIDRSAIMPAGPDAMQTMPAPKKSGSKRARKRS